MLPVFLEPLVKSLPAGNLAKRSIRTFPEVAAVNGALDWDCGQLTGPFTSSVRLFANTQPTLGEFQESDLSRSFDNNFDGPHTFYCSHSILIPRAH